MADSDLYNLEFLSLVAKITQEIDNYTGLSDKTLAEFVISLHDQSKTLPEFKAKLQEVGATFPDSFVENVDRLILTLHPQTLTTQVANVTAKQRDSPIRILWQTLSPGEAGSTRSSLLEKVSTIFVTRDCA